MLDVSAAVPIKHKRRKVSAVRDFPNGCGPLSVVFDAKAGAEPPASAAADTDKLSESHGALQPDGVMEFPAGREGACLDRVESLALLSVPTPERLESVCFLESLKPEDLDSSKGLEQLVESLRTLGPEGKEEEVGNERKGLPDQVEKLESTELLKKDSGQTDLLDELRTDEDAKEQCISRTYPPPKRRRLSAIRDFPFGCGSNASRMAREECLDAVASSKSKSLDVEKKPVGNQKSRAGESVMVETTGKVEGEVKANNTNHVQGRVQEIGKEGQVKYASKSSLNEGVAEERCEKKLFVILNSGKFEGKVKENDSKQVQERVQEIGEEVQAKSVFKSSLKEGIAEERREKNVLIRLNSGKAEGKVKGNDSKQVQESVEEIGKEVQAKSFFKSSLNEGIAEERREKKVLVRSNSEKVEGKVKGNDSKQVQERVQEIGNEVQAKSVFKSSLNEGIAEECREKKFLVRSNSEKAEGKVKGNDSKQVQARVQETGEEVQAKSVFMSSFNESIVEERSEKKVLDRSNSERKSEVHDVKKTKKNIQIREAQGSKPFHLDARSKVVEKEAIRSMGKTADKVSAKHQRDSQNLKRKFSDESDDENRTTNQYLGDKSLEAQGDRLIVQALTAAQYCPWRQGKQSDAISFRSVTPKKKAKKERQSSSKKLASWGVSASKHMNKAVMEEDEDSVPQAKDTNKSLVLYQGSRDASVSVTPFGPSSLSLKDGGSEDIVTRNEVRKVLRLFQVICRKLLQGEEAKSNVLGRRHRIDLKASGILKDNNEWVNTGKPIIGNVPGVEVGDEFHYRVELAIIGLHRPFQSGIDYTKRRGMVLATSIVASGGYPDDMDSSDVLTYSGSGGNPSGRDKEPGDQKLQRGNLALKNSIDAKTPVRVIRGFKEPKGSDSHDTRAKTVSTFTYDGMYLVERYWQEKARNGYFVFKFQLRRIPGQPELALKELKKSKKSKVREGLCIKDISEGKERIPISAVNTVDNDLPMPFRYITKIIYPSWYIQTPPRGCDCTDGCSDSEKCACAVKNGGEIPFNFDGAIVQAKTLVYECGPSCKCPSSCHNRVSQHGIKIPLEVFKTKSRGWGVRSLTSIPSGSFICEYAGELLQDKEAEQRENDEYLFDIGHNYDDHSLWEGLPTLIPDLQSSAFCETVEDVGFTIDAAEYGNVGRFINHSCSPNLYAQNLLYDHGDKRMPHIMLFAAENIPPLQELTYHYNYSLDQVLDSEGNIKQKKCYCGSPECTGRLY